MLRVFKFGGASIKDAASFHQAAAIIRKYPGDDIVLIVSAIGKTTNALENMFRRAFYEEADIHADYMEIRRKHFDLLKELFNDDDPVFSATDLLFNELLNTCLSLKRNNYNREYDALVSYGELISTSIIHHFFITAGINSTWLDVRKLIITDSSFRSANIDWEKTSGKIQSSPIRLKQGIKAGVYVTQGFIGGTNRDETTTLGREGSDFSAAIFAAVLDVKDIVIWKDVPGILNADPRIIQDACKLDEISYEEAIEMAWYGAQVIHPKTIQPLKKKGIPLSVKCFLDPDAEGTRISDSRVNDGKMPMIIFKEDQILISLKPKQLDLITEDKYKELQGVFIQCGITPNLSQHSAISLSVCVDNQLDSIRQVVSQLEDQYSIKYNEGLRLITIRHYNEETIHSLTDSRELLLEQKSRSVFQAIIRK